MAKTLDEFPQHLQKIGLLAIKTNYVDMYFEVIFRTITGIQPELTYAIFGAILNQRIRRDVLSAAAKVGLKRYPELLDELDALLRRVGKVGKKRADIVHAVYQSPVGNSDNPISFSPHEAGASAVRINELNQAIDQIETLNRDLKRFGLKVLKLRGRVKLENAWPVPPQQPLPSKSRRRPA